MTALFAPRPPVFTPIATERVAPVEAVVVRLPQRQSAEVYRIRRLVALALLAGIVIGVLSFGRQADATPSSEFRAEESAIVIVQPGDTLWAIARSLAPGGDPRELVDELSRLVDASALQPGQRIEIPGHLLD